MNQTSPVPLSANGLRILVARALDGRVEPPTDPLDAYSAIVVGVAENLTPRVASLRIRGRRGESAGSAAENPTTDTALGPMALYPGSGRR